MMDYHYRINKQGMKESKSDEIFRENISIYLAASNRLVSPDEVVIIENETGDYKKTKADINWTVPFTRGRSFVLAIFAS